MHLPNGQVVTPNDIKHDVDKATDINKKLENKVVLSFTDDELRKIVATSTISYTEVSGSTKLQDKNNNVIKSFAVNAN